MMSCKDMLSVLKNGGSLSRFGDGEFAIIGVRSIQFQKYNKNLAQKLKSALCRRSSKKLLIGIPPFNDKYNNPKHVYKNFSWWETYWLRRFKDLSEYLKNPLYANANFSRVSVFHELSFKEIKKRGTVLLLGDPIPH